MSVWTAAVQQIEKEASEPLGIVLLAAMGAVLTVAGFTALVWKIARPHLEAYFADLMHKTNEVHRQVTVNGGKNNPPTMLDDMSLVKKLLGNLGEQLVQTHDLVDQHGTELAEVKRLASSNADAIKRSEERGQQYLGEVQLVFRDHGIEIPLMPKDDE